MKGLTLRNIAKVCGGVYHGSAEALDKEVMSIITDSRKAEPGCLFVAIVGERVDGHRFIPQVMEAGALAAVSERELEEPAGPYIQVESSLQAVKDIAEFYLGQLGIPVVGITGSVGKTSTKEVVASVLKEKYRTLKTQGNFNNELGLPLTVFRLREEDEIAVLEMGISDFGEMTRLARIAKPDTCVITNIGTCHLENLGDRDGVFRAKTEIFKYLRPDGHIVLNGDDDKLSAVTEYQGIRPVFFGLKDAAAGECGRRTAAAAGENTAVSRDVYADEIVSRGLKGMTCRIHAGGESFVVDIPMPGRHMVYNALAATAVGQIYGLTPQQIKHGVETLEPLGGRFHMIETEKLLIVDDCYNANPMSMKASLDVLKDGAGRRVAILGDMGELGTNEIALHEEVGRHAADTGIDVLICVGSLSAHMAEAAREASRAEENEAAREASRTEVNEAAREASRAEENEAAREASRTEVNEAACETRCGTARKSVEKTEKTEGAEHPRLRVFHTAREELLSNLKDYINPGDTVLVKASHFMHFEEVVEKLQELF